MTSSADASGDEELKQVTSQESAAPTATAAGAVGGLLIDGKDVRRVQLEDVEDKLQRRKNAWRGVERCPTAVISFDHAMKTFEYKLEALVLGSDLRVYIFFIIAFCFFFLVGRNISDVHFFSAALRDKVMETEVPVIKVARFYRDIAEASDFVTWAIDVFLIQTIDPTYPTGAPYFVGATRFRTLRVRKDTCQVNPAIIPSSMPPAALECYGGWSDGNEDKGKETNSYNEVRRWRYRSCQDMGGGTQTSGLIATYHCGGYSFELPWWRNATDPALSQVLPYPSSLHERLPKSVAQDSYVAPAFFNNPPFIDNLATRFVVVEFFAYHPTLKVFMSIKAFAEAAAGGLWIPGSQTRVFDVWTSTQTWKTVYDAFFALFVLYYVFEFFADLIRFRRTEGRTLAFFFDTWNLLEFTNISILLVVIVLKIMWITLCIKTDLKLDTLIFSDVYPVRLEDILNLYIFQVYLNSVNTVLTFLKVLKFFRLNDRLNVLTRTLAESQDSILGVLLIFLLVVTAFAMTGHGLFGLGVWAFRSVDASFSTLLQMLVGQFDYSAMKNENRILAGMFFWSYIILAQFCLLNFLIGVLMEAFAEVSKSRTILPLEAIMLKTWEDFKRVFHPSNIKRLIVNTCKGESKEVLLRRALELLRQHRETIYPSDVDEPVREDKQLLTKAMFLAAFPPDLIDKLSDVYLEYVWNDLVYEWDQSETASEAVASHHNIAMTARGVQLAIGKQLETMQTFGDRLSKIEKKLLLLVDRVENS